MCLYNIYLFHKFKFIYPWLLVIFTSTLPYKLLFIIFSFTHREVREVNARVLGRGLKLVDGNDNEWKLKQLLFADDTVVVADSERKQCQLVTEFGRVSERRKL